MIWPRTALWVHDGHLNLHNHAWTIYFMQRGPSDATQRTHKNIAYFSLKMFSETYFGVLFTRKMERFVIGLPC